MRKMNKLEKIIAILDNEILLEISERTILYHYSENEYEEGEIVDYKKLLPSEKEKRWLENKFIEKKLEEFREKFAPHRPSRFKSVFCSVVPSSAFKGKGILYEVKPIGKTFTTFAYLINEINKTFNDVSYIYAAKIGVLDNEEEFNKYKWKTNKEKLYQLFADYWKVKAKIDREIYTPRNLESLMKKNPKWIEILCEKAKVIKVVGRPSEYLKKGDKVRFKETIKVSYYGYDASGNKKVSDEKKKKIIKDFNGKVDKESFLKDDWILIIPKNTIGEILSVDYSQSPLKGTESWKIDRGKYKKARIKIDNYNFTVTLPLSLKEERNLKIEDIIERI